MTANKRAGEVAQAENKSMKLLRKIGHFTLPSVALCILRALRVLLWLLLAWMVGSIALGSVAYFFGLEALRGRILDSLPDSLVVRELVLTATGSVVIMCGRLLWRALERNAAIRAEKDERQRE